MLGRPASEAARRLFRLGRAPQGRDETLGMRAGVMELKLYDTLTREKRPFTPLDPQRVRLYVCGPTVYDFAHIGNARPVIVFDVLFRLLRHLYGAEHVTYVRNITAIVERLIANGHAYVAEGHVLFDVPSMKDYGKLSRRSLDDMIAGARIDVAPYKRGEMDFVLWKPSTSDQPGWDSPWGRGRPGWHIECSAMSENTLGETFDIHGGGLDLIFPHHENEIAQSVCAHAGRPFARYWLHNGMLTVGGAKMAKSEGNFITVRDALSQAPGEVIRLALLGTHYRAPLDWTEDRLHEARQTLDRLYRALALKIDGKVDHDRAAKQASSIIAALEDDLNVPLALSELHAETVAINRYHQSMPDDCVTGQEVLRTCGRLLGILEDDPTGWLQTVSTI